MGGVYSNLPLPGEVGPYRRTRHGQVAAWAITQSQVQGRSFPPGKTPDLEPDLVYLGLGAGANQAPGVDVYPFSAIEEIVNANGAIAS